MQDYQQTLLLTAGAGVAERCFCRLTPTWRPNQGRSSISAEDVNTSWQATRGSCGQHQVPRPVCVIINRCGHIERGQVHKCPFHSGGGGGLARRRVGTPEGRGPPPPSLKEPGFWVFCFSSLKHEKASAWLFNLRRGLSPDEAVLFSLLPLRSQPAFDGTSKAQRAQETRTMLASTRSSLSRLPTAKR